MAAAFRCPGNGGGQLDEGPGQDIGHHHVKLTFQDLQRLSRHLHALFDGIEAGVFGGDATRIRLDVARQHPLRTQGGGGYRQDARAGPHVQHPFRYGRMFEQSGKRFQAETGGSVGSRSEGHAWIQIDHHIPRGGGKILPGRLDHQARTEADGLEMLLPPFCPVFRAYFPDFRQCRNQARYETGQPFQPLLDQAPQGFRFSRNGIISLDEVLLRRRLVGVGRNEGIELPFLDRHSVAAEFGKFVTDQVDGRCRHPYAHFNPDLFHFFCLAEKGGQRQ